MGSSVEEQRLRLSAVATQTTPASNRSGEVGGRQSIEINDLLNECNSALKSSEVEQQVVV
jgi:hypothetical protein